MVNISNFLQESFRVYSSCVSYRDHGSIAVCYLDDQGQSLQPNTTIRFATEFLRPTHLRFELTRNDSGRERHYAIWCGGVTAYAWGGMNRQTAAFLSILDAFSGVTAVSSGLAIRVPSLLLPQEWPGDLKGDLTRAEMVGRKQVASAECLLIRRVQLGGVDTTLLVDATTGVIRRMQVAYEPGPDPKWRTYLLSNANVGEEVKRKVHRYARFGPARIVATADYIPELNINIDRDSWSVIPPSEPVRTP